VAPPQEIWRATRLPRTPTTVLAEPFRPNDPNAPNDPNVYAGTPTRAGRGAVTLARRPNARSAAITASAALP